MAKKQVAPQPTQAQIDFVKNNCQTHDEQSLVDATGLDLETAAKLRAEALKNADSDIVKQMTQLHPGVVAMTGGMSARVSDSASQTHEDQKRQLEERQATFIHKIRP